MNFIYQYNLFLAKIITYLVLAIIFIFFISYCFKKKNKQNYKLKLININKFYHTMVYENFLNQLQINQKYNLKKNFDFKSNKPMLYFLKFYGDIHANEISHLRKEISTIISIIKPNDEVLLSLESAGGTVHEYGLAAAQLQRLRDRNIKLEIVIDKVAASGGYMMACVANYIYAAPFAIIGSIGVIAQIPNFNKLLKKNNIDVELHTAGNCKRNLTIFGENNNYHRKIFKDKLNITHELFKKFIFKMRPIINIEEVSNGDYWFGSIAIKKKLIDEINTSDDVILNKMKDFNIVSIKYIKSKNILNNFMKYFFKNIINIL